ncbi:nicotinate-nucleotide adenylyltransferase [Hathewaya histolytica]|uniref:Probable nicotinate-nucleotide adenylyltransferase n=1 Tax=Hathewaya histolytica TaxID=1498 RepID=A0A4U9RJN8_HATHI|nr:nicotinate-nucleotide adenylyltransferase [Hathewaya histolytica]VTQ90803.1 nicotinic acid mononucleotide adenylyltransferase [Hathewaya histolytica]
MLKKGIFGGTFDPIHNGHLNIAYEALHRLKMDEIYFVPTGNPPHKNLGNITSANLRYEMVKIAIRDEKAFKVSNYEIKKTNRGYTYETLEYFNNKEKNTIWYFIVGADCLFNIEDWKNTYDIFNKCILVVFGRKGYNEKELLEQKKHIEDKYNTSIIFINTPLLEISSTEIRNKINENIRVDFLMPKGVYNTIVNFNLYK